MGMVKEFKEFAMRGNVMDMAVGIVIGAAFGGIVKSFVADVIMPPIGMVTGGVDFSKIVVELQAAVLDAEGKVTTPAVNMNVGLFVNAIINFLIIAFAIFMVIKMMNNLKKKEEEAPAEPAAPPKQEVLLEEIRDLMKAKG